MITEKYDLHIYSDEGRLEILQVNIGPSKAVKENQFQWTDNVIGNLGKSQMIRIGLKSLHNRNDLFLLFADENSENSKGIVYNFNIHGNWDTNGPGYRKKDGGNWNIVEQFSYKGNTVPLNEEKWFEFEWSLEGDEMSVSMIANERGEEKQLMHSFPTRDNKINWLMFASGWYNYATVTTYIINGSPREEEIQEFFNKKLEQ